MKKKLDLNAGNYILYKKIIAVILLLCAVGFFVPGTVMLNRIEQTYRFTGTQTFYRGIEPLDETADAKETANEEEEEYEDNLLIPVVFGTADRKYGLTLSYHYVEETDEAENEIPVIGWGKNVIKRMGNGVETWLLTFTKRTYGSLSDLPEDASIVGYVYENEEGHSICFDHEASDKELIEVVRNENADTYSSFFSTAMALLLAGVAFSVIGFFGKHFTNYEQIWFISFMVVAAVVSIIAPEESANGVNGIVIMALYLADTFLNLLCELLISKQSKWNFIVSVFVEITEIVICVVLMYRFATLASTLFFWLPCDIISFINWHKHPDQQEEELTKVRTLKGWQEILIISVIVLWTLVVGYFLSQLDFLSDFIQNRSVKVVVDYMDACVTAVGIANGLFILFRFREQWIAWYIDAALEAAINILSGQFVLLVLKVGYFTNTTYGYIKWTKYIKSREAEGAPEAAAVPDGTRG